MVLIYLLAVLLLPLIATLAFVFTLATVTAFCSRGIGVSLVEWMEARL
jgi:hypothetical protein